MKNWIKKNLEKETVIEICKKYNVDSLTASVFARRGILSGQDIQFFLENDLRFLHSPFLFNQMEDAVDRILDAKDEGEKVLIFGDRDVDGITATTILYEYLTSIGLDVEYRVPLGDESYGITIDVIDEFASNYGTLIITVDCGISNLAEIAHAIELGIDVIVTDHHTPQEKIPENAIIINPKIADENYPFCDISGCAVAFKLIQALRFSQTELYKQDICLLNCSEFFDENSSTEKKSTKFKLECVKLHNNIEKEKFVLENITDLIKISDTKLESFLKGQQIFTWDDNSTKTILKNIFGSAVEFNTFDIRNEIAKIIPSVKNMTLEQLKSKSKIARYKDDSLENSSLMDSFVNIFITYINQKSNEAFANKQNLEEQELELVALAALADVMPLKNENRIFINYALKIMNAGRIRSGLTELLSRMNMLGKKITSTDLAWNLIPALNATGRLGQPELAINLLMEKDSVKRAKIADKIVELNTERKSLVTSASEFVNSKAIESFNKYQNFCLIYEKNINRGIVGLLAARLSQKFKVPAIVITTVDDKMAVGSMRSLRGVDCPSFLTQFKDFFTNFGGHNKAAGFGLELSKIDSFLAELEKAIFKIQLEQDTENDLIIDAELPTSYITPKLFDLTDLFEPYGEKNKPLIFMTKNVKIFNHLFVGKSEKQHLKLTFDLGAHKIPGMYWSAADKIGTEFNDGDCIDIVYNVERNVFNGMENIQLIILDSKKSN